MHLPVNHRFRTHWRLLAGFCGVLLLVFGVLGIVETAGQPLTGRGDVHVLGLPSNPAFAWLSAAVGAAVVPASIAGRTAAHLVSLGAGALLLLAGLGTLTLLETSLTVFDLGVATSVASMLVGAALLTAGLYSRVGSPERSAAEEVLRHSTRPGDKFTVEPQSGR